MHHQSVTPFGARPVSACLLKTHRLATAPSNTSEVDKWALFHNLRKARAAFGLTKSGMVVLNALLSFYPAATLEDGAQLVVFPSNSALSDRAHCMAESTLRRHLTALVTAGLIRRNDSPNGKRFALRARAGVVIQAYGFDLRPMLVQAAKIQALAEAAEDAALALKLARQAVTTKLRDIHKLIAYAAELGVLLDVPPLAAVQNALRRKQDLEKLQNLACQLGDISTHIEAQFPTESTEMDGSDSQNERHLQNSYKEYYESESEMAPVVQSSKVAPKLSLDLLLKACPDIQPYGQGEIRTWYDLIKAANHIYPMMGISKSAWTTAQTLMGAETAAAVLAAILQRVAQIRAPGGYLRKLTEKHSLGKLSLHRIIMSLLNRPHPTAA